MKNIKIMFFSFIFILLGFITLNVEAATSIKETGEGYTQNAYVIGGTKFTTTVTSTKAFKAGKAYYELCDKLNVCEEDIKTYYYSNIFKKWYVVPEEGGTLEALTEKDNEKVQEGLNIFYVNNEEKILEYPTDYKVVGNVHEEAGVKYENGVFKIPATVLSFAFETEDGGYKYVDTTLNTEDDEYEFGDFYIPEYLAVYNYEDRNNLDDENVWMRAEFQLDKNGKIIEYGDDYIYQSNDQNAVDGYVDKDGNPIDILSMNFKQGDVVFQKLSLGVVSIWGVNYSAENFVKALESTSAEKEAYLISDYVSEKLITLSSENKDMYLNLDTHTLSRNGGGFVIYLTGKNSTLNISNGTISNVTGQAITVGKETTETQNVKAIINSDVIINTENIGIAAIGEGAQVDFYGAININSEDGIGISGNGNKNAAGANINVYPGATIDSEYEGSIALYLPHEGETNVVGATFTAATAIGIKAGTLNISESHLNAFGAVKSPELYNNGVNSTGDVIYVEMNKGYLDNIKINVNDSSLSSENGKAILVYNPDNMDVPEINAVDYNTILVDDNKTYYSSNDEADIMVGDRGYYVVDIVSAIKASSEENPATLMKDVQVLKTATINIDESKDLYLDLNGYKLSRINGSFVLYLLGKNYTLHISNGIIENTAGQAITVGDLVQEDQNIKAVVNSDVTINTERVGISVTGKGAQLDFYGKININKESGAGINGNGGANAAGTVINVYPGAVISSDYEDTVALYLPQKGITTVNGATLTAATPGGIKSGEVNILNSTLNAFGTYKDPVLYNDGIAGTGDAIYAEVNNSYLKDIKLSVTNSQLSSVNGEAILVYNPTETDQPEVTTDIYTNIVEDGDKTYYSALQ